MSTRAYIEVKTSEGIYEVLIYKHSDGYPEGVLPSLAPFAKRFFEVRQDDAEYFVAQYLMHIGADLDIHSRSFRGWGCMCKPHGDEEYAYTVDLTQEGQGQVIVREI